MFDIFRRQKDFCAVHDSAISRLNLENFLRARKYNDFNISEDRGRNPMILLSWTGPDATEEEWKRGIVVIKDEAMQKHTLQQVNRFMADDDGRQLIEIEDAMPRLGEMLGTNLPAPQNKHRPFEDGPLPNFLKEAMKAPEPAKPSPAPKITAPKETPPKPTRGRRHKYDNIVIESDIPLPEKVVKKKDKRKTHTSIAWDFKVGQSAFFPHDQYPNPSGLFAHVKKKKKWDFRTKEETKDGVIGTRVWRTK